MNKLPTTRRAAEKYLRRTIEDNFVEHDADDIEKIEVSIMNYIATGISDGWSVALTKETDDSFDVKTLNLIEKDPSDY